MRIYAFTDVITVVWTVQYVYDGHDVMAVVYVKSIQSDLKFEVGSGFRARRWLNILNLFGWNVGYGRDNILNQL